MSSVPDRRTILFYLLPPMLALIVVTTIEFKTDLSTFIIAGDNAEEILLASEMQSGTLSRRYLIAIGSTSGQRVPKSVALALRNELKKIEGVVDVWLPARQSRIARTMMTLYSRYAGALYSLNPETDLASLFNPRGLTKRAAFLKKGLLSPQGAVIKQLALNDPLLLTLNGFQRLSQQMQSSASTAALYQNLILETAMAGLDAPQQNRIQQAIKAVFTSFNQTRHEHYRLEMTGVPVFAVATQQQIQGDITRVMILSSFLLILLFLLLFRSIGTLFQVFTLLASVILASIVTTGVVFGYVHGMTVAIGSTLVGICVDYPIHAIAHARTVAARERVGIVAKIWPSMLLGGITTMVGYVALGASGYPGFQQVAVYAGSGIFVALLLTRFVLPRLSAGNSRRPLNIPLLAGWALLCHRFRPWLVVALLVAVTVSLPAMQSLRWLDDMQELTPELNALKDNDKRIRSRMVSIEPGRFILVTGTTTEAALQKTEETYRVLDQLQRDGALKAYFGLYPWLLSVRQQRENQQRLSDYFTGQNRRLWQQALEQQGLSVAKLGHFNDPFTEPLTLQRLFTTDVKRVIDSRVIVDEQQTIVMIWLTEHQPDRLKAAFAAIDGAHYFSQRDLLNNMTRNYTDRARTLLMAGLVVIILLLVWRYKSPLKALQTLLPAVLAAFFILALWSFSGAAISFLHLVGLLLVVAICVDYGIFYQENRGGDRALTYQAMAASMLTSALAFGSLLAADSTPLQILAGVVTVGVMLGFIFCPIVIRNEDETSSCSIVTGHRD